MRIRLGCVASLVLASLSCNPRPTEPYPERLSCPREHTLVHDETPPVPECALFDTDPANGVADLKVCVRLGSPMHTEVAIAGGTTYRGEYDKTVAISWDRPDKPAPAALELAPPELSRVIPSLQRVVEPSCLAEPQVSAYLGELRDRTRGRWLPPPLDKDAVDANRNVVVMLSLSASGEITGACFEPTVLDSVGASAVRALQKAAPFDSMTTEPESEYRTETKTGKTTEVTTETKTPVKNLTECLAGRRVIANFTVR